VPTPARRSRPDDAGATTPTGAVADETRRGRAASRLIVASRRGWHLLRRWWPVIRWVLGLALLALAVDVLASHTGELSGIGTVLDHLRWWWLVPALIAEAASELSFVAVQTRLLGAGGLHPRLAPLAGLTLASQAMTNSVPGGPAVAAVYGFRWYRRFGADDTLASWALVGTTVFAALSLALLAAIGLVFATEQGASLDLVPAVLGVLAVTIVLGVLFVYERPLEVVVRRGLRTSHRLIGRPRGDHESHVVAILDRLSRARLQTLRALEVVTWALLNWLFDCTCFGFAFLAIGSSVPWKGLLLAYGAGQLAANLPITPGGLGTVEGSITIALSYFGGGTGADIAAVLVYRLISFWLVLLVGWGSWGGLALGVRRGRWARSALHAPVEAGVVTAPTSDGSDDGDATEKGEGRGPQVVAAESARGLGDRAPE
jgi:putative heme transporter